MKEVKAYIKQHKLDEVIRALRKIEGLSGVSILAVQGFGHGWHARDEKMQTFAGRAIGAKLEIICRDELVDLVVAVIETTAHTGLKGDGKIYVTDIEQAVRISTGERGPEAA